MKLFSTQKKNKQIKQTRQTWKYLHMGNSYKEKSQTRFAHIHEVTVIIYLQMR